MNKLYDKFRFYLRYTFLSVVGHYKTLSPGIHLLNGHYLKDNIESIDRFKKMLLILSKNAKLVRVEEAIAMIVKHEMPQEPIIAFTFDDGFMECYTNFAPILEEYGINGLFFINPNYVDGDETYIHNFNNSIVFTQNKKPMRWVQLKELQNRGHIIGAHTMDHYMINTDDENELEYQIGYCKQIIEEQLRVKCNYFAFPYGKIEHANTKAIDIACMHYKYVFSQSDYKHYFSFNGRVINRRHFEPFWPISHVKYFLSANKR